MESWLIWNLSGGVDGGVHVTDVTNASRTLLMDLHTLSWDDDLLAFFGVPEVMLPQIKSSTETYGTARKVFPGVLIGAALGDQQAALCGPTCFAPGETKRTYGTGAFLLMNTGTTPVRAGNGLLTTVGYKIGDEPAVYALEGSIAIGRATGTRRIGSARGARGDGETGAVAISSPGDLGRARAHIRRAGTCWSRTWTPSASGTICRVDGRPPGLRAGPYIVQKMSGRARLITVTGHDATRVLTLDRPEVRNAIDVPTRELLRDELRRAVDDPAVRAVVLTGAGGTFSAGGDVRSMEGAGPDAVRARLAPLHETVRLIATGGTPVIAAIEGVAAGLGVSLAAVCDHVVAAEDARFVAAFGKVGLVPDGGLLWTLPRRVGMGRARDMLLFGTPVPASRAYEIGLADSLAPPGAALAAALERAAGAAALAPLSVAAAKRLLVGDGLERLMEAECLEQAALFGTVDFAEGRAAFAERRPPRFEGR